MTQTSIAPNGNTVTDHDHPTWNVRSYRKPGALVSKVIAITPSGKVATHRDKVADKDLDTVIAELCGDAKRVALPVNIMDVLSASIDAAKAVA